MVAPRRVFPELITEVAELGEEQFYGAGAELVVEWREAWSARKAARYTLDWLRAERRRRERESNWHRRALGRLRWQLPLSWGLHGLLHAITLGLWGRARQS